MKQHIKRYLACFGLLTLMLAPAIPAHAQFDSIDSTCNASRPAGADTPTLCDDNSTDQAVGSNSIYGPNGILTKAARILSIIVGIASVIMIIIGGLKYVLAAGDTTSITNAKNTIMYAVVGLVVALLAQAIITFVLLRL